MRRASMLVVMLLFASFCPESGGGQPRPAGSGQSAEGQQAVSSQQVKTTFRPRVSMQDALKIAEDHIGKQHIDIRPFWLYRAIYILSGDKKTSDKDKTSGWHFWWVNENGAAGDYVEIFVDMDGKAYRMSSM